MLIFFFFSSRRRHTRSDRDWSSDVCSSDLAPADIGRDAGRMEIVQRVSEDYEHVLAQIGPAARYRDDVKAVRWMIEELRVSLFAQPIGAAIPVSEQRILAALDRL